MVGNSNKYGGLEARVFDDRRAVGTLGALPRAAFAAAGAPPVPAEGQLELDQVGSGSKPPRPPRGPHPRWCARTRGHPRAGSGGWSARPPGASNGGKSNLKGFRKTYIEASVEL